MNSKAFSLSLIIAGFASFMVYSYLDNKESVYKKEYGDLTTVIVAKVDIKELELIDETKIIETLVPKKYQAPGHFKKRSDLFNTVAAVPIKKGEQITQPRITYPGDRAGLSRQIALGKRAITIKVNNSQGVGHLIKPGDRVDLMAFMDYAGGAKEKMLVMTPLQDIYVLSTGKKITNNLPLVGIKTDKEVKTMNLDVINRYDSLTLEVTPDQAQKIFFLQSGGGRIYLSLRNNDDKTIDRVATTKLFNVMGENSIEAKDHFNKIEEEKRKRQGN